MSRPGDHTDAPRRRRRGLAALGKCIVLLLGVPGALARLWMASLANALRPGAAGLVLHLLLFALSATWLLAASQLARDLTTALRGRDAARGTWSARWAIALAGLLVATSAVGAVVTTPPAPTLAAATALAPKASRPATRPADEIAAALALVGLGTLGTAALARRLGVLRRASECLRRPGERPPASDPQSCWAEALLGPLAVGAVLDWVEGANRLLWRSLRTGGTDLPPVVLVRASAHGVELLLDTPSRSVPDGFCGREGGRRLEVAPDLDLDTLGALTAGCGRYLPALVPVGEDSDGCYLVPLPPGRRLAIEGETESVRAYLGALLAALRTLPWAEELTVELVGCQAPPIAEHCYQLNASSYRELQALTREPPAPIDRLEMLWAASPLIVCAEAPGTSEEALLAQLTAHAGVISLGGAATDRLVLDAAGAFFEPLGITLEPPRPTAAQQALVDVLLADASQPAVLAMESTPPPHPVLPFPEAGAVEIRILSERPCLSGGLAPGGRDGARVVEVLAWLALHGYEATPEALQRRVFARAGSPGSPGRVHNVVSAARRTLGEAPGGGALLSTLRGGRYVLNNSVSLDWLRFRQLAEAARALPVESALAALAQALTLVEAPRSWRKPPWAWLVAEGTDREIAASVVDAAHHLATLRLAASDLAGAEEAITRGRALEPASEILARDLMAVREAAGDPEGAQAILAELEMQLLAIGGNEPSEATRQLADTWATDGTPCQ